jgi:two-component system, NarL family, response regulator NreC
MTLDSQPGSAQPSPADCPGRRVFLIDSQSIFREALRLIVDMEPAFEVVGDAGTATEAATLIDSLKPDVILTECALPDRTGMQFISDLHARWPHVGILVLTALGPIACKAAASRSGVLGCLPKSCGSAELLRAISQVASGRKYMGPSLQTRRGRAADPDLPSSSNSVSLTARQRQILRHVALGHKNIEIGAMLGISTKSVSKHRTGLRNALRIRTTAGLIRYAVREGFVTENCAAPIATPAMPARHPVAPNTAPHL